MDRETELRLIEQGLSLVQRDRRHLDDYSTERDSHHYLLPERYAQEAEAVFNALPHTVAHTSELPGANDFLVRELNGHSVLLSRGSDGIVRAFRNVCRHRGMKLVDTPHGCKRRFVCPYHAWSYDAEGRLIGAPHFDEGFPDLQKQELGLDQFAVLEHAGLIWVSTAKGATTEQIQAHLGPIATDLEWLDMADLSVAAETRLTIRANWKLLVEGGLEAYHFKVAHRDTIGPFFTDNQSTYQTFGPHIRSVLLRASFAELGATPTAARRLRSHANLLYTLLPTTQLLVQQDHVIWISSRPSGPDLTELRLVTLGHRVSENPAYWQKNHEITEATLREDFEIGEHIQSGLSAEFPQRFRFGRFEGALAVFNQTVDAYLDSA